MNHVNGEHYLTVINDSNFQKQIILHDNESAYHSFLVFASEKPTNCTVSVTLQGKKSLAEIRIICFVCNQKPVHIDGAIIIAETGDQTTGRLLEEVVILGDHSYTLTKPILDIKNNNVLASHGAKIHRINDAQLFYLNSRGLDKAQAKQIIIEGMIHSLFEHNPVTSIMHNDAIVNISDIQQYKDILVKQIISNDQNMH